MHEIRPMHAMKQDYHLKQALNHGFAKVSDKIREELIIKGMSERDATISAPQQLEGIISTFTGEIDFKKIHHSLDAEKELQTKPKTQALMPSLSCIIST